MLCLELIVAVMCTVHLALDVVLDVVLGVALGVDVILEVVLDVVLNVLLVKMMLMILMDLVLMHMAFLNLTSKRVNVDLGFMNTILAYIARKLVYLTMTKLSDPSVSRTSFLNSSIIISELLNVRAKNRYNSRLGDLALSFLNGERNHVTSPCAHLLIG